MMGFTLLGVVLIFLSVGLNIQTAESCTCIQRHPQDQFCTSETVIVADVTGKSGPVKGQDTLFRYEIKNIQVLKGSNNAKHIKYVNTNPQSACRVRLNKGRYMLSGHQIKYGIEVIMCGLVKRWDLLSLTEQENFKQTYKMGCNCMISRCSGSPCCPKSKKECMWDTHSPHFLEYACLEDSDGICNWYWPASRVDDDAMCTA